MGNPCFLCTSHGFSAQMCPDTDHWQDELGTGIACDFPMSTVLISACPEFKEEMMGLPWWCSS